MFVCEQKCIQIIVTQCPQINIYSLIHRIYDDVEWGMYSIRYLENDEHIVLERCFDDQGYNM